jgi:hypothetical protein
LARQCKRGAARFSYNRQAAGNDRRQNEAQIFQRIAPVGGTNVTSTLNRRYNKATYVHRLFVRATAASVGVFAPQAKKLCKSALYTEEMRYIWVVSFNQ